MTKTKSTKRALLMSALSLLMCVSMLIGSTFAWFTDTASTAVNKIQAGNLKVDLEMQKPDGSWVSAKGETLEFKKATDAPSDEKVLWEPGCTYELPQLRVVNKGDLALKYKVIISGVNGNAKLLEAIDFFVKIGDAEKVALADWDGILLPDGEAATDTMDAGTTSAITISGTMKKEAGNEYQGLSIDGIGITVLATQYTYENDSFGNQYDANAPEVEVVVDSTEELEAALTAGKKIIGVKGSVELAAAPAGQNRDMDHVTLVGLTDDATITVTGNGGGLDNLNLKDIKVVDSTFYTYGNGENAWEFTYLELGGTATYTNVVFDDGVMSDGSRANFVNCTFNGHNNDSSAHGNVTMYGAWVYNGEATFTNCTFVGTRGIKICDQYSPEVGTVVIDGCTFNGISEKPGVAIDDEDTQDMNIIIKNSTFINCQAGDQGLYVYETDNTLPTVSNNIVESYTSLVEIGTKEELVAFANRVNGGDGMSGAMVKLTDNIDLAGMEWTPIGQTGTSYGATNYFQGIFDGQGHTISNMTIANTNSGNNYAAGFFGFIDAAKVTIRNVNFDNANVKGHHWTGVVAGYLTGNIEKCNVTNSTVSCTHANNDACGDKAGIIVGYVNNGLVNNCTASNSTVTAGRDAGQIAGASKTAYVANCTATNVTVTANDGCTGANIREDIIGRVL